MRHGVSKTARAVCDHAAGPYTATPSPARILLTSPSPARAPRAEAAHRFPINPFGLRFDAVTASNLVTVDLEGTILSDSCGAGINPAGFTIYSAVHAARPELTCVLHTHTRRHPRGLDGRWHPTAEPVGAAIP